MPINAFQTTTDTPGAFTKQQQSALPLENDAVSPSDFPPEESTVSLGDTTSRRISTTIGRSGTNYFAQIKLPSFAGTRSFHLFIKPVNAHTRINITFLNSDGDNDAAGVIMDWAVPSAITSSPVTAFAPIGTGGIALSNLEDRGDAGYYALVTVTDADASGGVDQLLRFGMFSGADSAGDAGPFRYDVVVKEDIAPSTQILAADGEIEWSTQSVANVHLEYGADGVLSLPPLVDVPVGAKVELLNVDGFKYQVTPQTGEGDVYLHDVGRGTVTVRRTNAGWAITPENAGLNYRVKLAESPNTASNQTSEDLAIANGRTVAECFDEFDFIEYEWSFGTGSVWGNDIGQPVSRFATEKLKIAGTTASLFENQAGSDYLRGMLNGGNTFNIRTTGAMTYRHMTIYGIKGTGEVPPGTNLTSKMGYGEWLADGGGGSHAPVGNNTVINIGNCCPNENLVNDPGITFDGTVWTLPEGLWELECGAFLSANNALARWQWDGLGGVGAIGNLGTAQGAANAGGGGTLAAKGRVQGPVQVRVVGRTAGSSFSGGLGTYARISLVSQFSAVRAEDAQINEIPIITSTGTTTPIVGVDYNIEGKFNGRQVKAAYVKWANLAHATAFGILNNFHELKGVRDEVYNATAITDSVSYRTTAGSGESDSSVQILTDGTLRFLLTGAGTQDSGRCLLLWTEV